MIEEAGRKSGRRIRQYLQVLGNPRIRPQHASGEGQKDQIRRGRRRRLAGKSPRIAHLQIGSMGIFLTQRTALRRPIGAFSILLTLTCSGKRFIKLIF
jgi:hypothetical protein